MDGYVLQTVQWTKILMEKLQWFKFPMWLSNKSPMDCLTVYLTAKQLDIPLEKKTIEKIPIVYIAHVTV